MTKTFPFIRHTPLRGLTFPPSLFFLLEKLIPPFTRCSFFPPPPPPQTPPLAPPRRKLLCRSGHSTLPYPPIFDPSPNLTPPLPATHTRRPYSPLLTFPLFPIPCAGINLRPETFLIHTSLRHIPAFPPLFPPQAYGSFLPPCRLPDCDILYHIHRHRPLTPVAVSQPGFTLRPIVSPRPYPPSPPPPWKSDNYRRKNSAYSPPKSNPTNKSLSLPHSFQPPPPSPSQ